MEVVQVVLEVLVYKQAIHIISKEAGRAVVGLQELEW